MPPAIDAAIEAELLRLKDAALAATGRGDGEFYRNYLADDAIAVVPAGIFRKEEIVRAMAEGSFRSTRVEAATAKVLGPDVGMVTYRATFARDGETWEAFVTTIYRRTSGEWKGAFYQQTPLGPR